MGIRFRCHHCEHELHVKDFLGGKRGKCPECQGRFRVPAADAEHSLAVASEAPQPEVAPARDAVAPAPTDSSLETNSAVSVTTEPKIDSVEAPGAPAPSPPVAAPAPMPQALPQALAEAPGATWYVRPTTGGQYGPASSTDFHAWLEEKRISRDSLVWRDGWQDWIPAETAFNDYFGPAQDPLSQLPAAVPATQMQELDGQMAADTVHSNISEPPVFRDFAEGTSSTQPIAPSLSEKNRLNRKQRRKRNHAIMVAVLSVVAVTLIIALVIVLSIQSQ